MPFWNSFNFQSRSPNAIPLLPLSPKTKTHYYYKTHQSRTVSIPSHQRGGKIHVGPDDNETKSYVSRIDTTNLGPRRHARRLGPEDEMDDDDSGRNDMKPFFRAGELIRMIRVIFVKDKKFNGKFEFCQSKI